MVVICIWWALFVTLQFDVIFVFQTNILAKFADIIDIFFYTHSPYFMCLCTEYKLSALQGRISEENKLNATTQQSITAKISACALKQGRKTHSSLCQSNLQLQNEAALMSRRIRAVEHRCAQCRISPTLPPPRKCLQGPPWWLFIKNVMLHLVAEWPSKQNILIPDAILAEPGP